METEAPYRGKKYQKDPDISEYNFPSYLNAEILRLYRAGGFETHKGERQKKILLACAILAMINLQEIPVRAQLVKKLGLDPKKCGACSIYIQELRKFCTNSIKIYTPEDLIIPYLRQANKLDEEEKIVEYWRNLLAKNPRLSDEEPTSMACYLLITLKMGPTLEICEYYGIPFLRIKELINELRD